MSDHIDYYFRYETPDWASEYPCSCCKVRLTDYNCDFQVIDYRHDSEGLPVCNECLSDGYEPVQKDNEKYCSIEYPIGGYRKDG